MNHTTSSLLEDRVFGVDTTTTSPPTTPGRRCRSPPATGGGGPDPVTRCMLPSVLAVVAAMVVVWSLTKSVQYSELFPGFPSSLLSLSPPPPQKKILVRGREAWRLQVNARYQYGMCAVNAAVVVLAVAIVAIYPTLGGWASHREKKSKHLGWMPARGVTAADMKRE